MADGGVLTELAQSYSSRVTVSIPVPQAVPPSAGRQSIGAVHGLASNAAYMSFPIPTRAGDPVHVQNMLIHVRSSKGATLRAMASVDALPVPSSFLVAASHRWSSDSEDRTLPIGALVVPEREPQQLLASIEQTEASVAAAAAEVWVELLPDSKLEAAEIDAKAKEEEVLAALDAVHVSGKVCCGGYLVYEVQPPPGTQGGSVALRMEASGSGSKSVTLLATPDRVPSRSAFSYSAKTGASLQEFTIYLGSANDTDRLASTWYAAVVAGPAEEGTAETWEATSASFKLSALYIPPGEGSIQIGAAWGRFNFPIWVWVLIAISLGIGLGFVLLVAAYLNKLAYKKLRQKMYHLEFSPVTSPRDSAHDLGPTGVSGWVLNQSPGQESSSLWSNSPDDGASPKPAAKDSLIARTATSADGDKGRAAEGTKPATGLMASLLGRFGRRADGERRGLLSGQQSKPIWYDPKTFHHPDDDADEEVLATAHAADPQPENTTVVLFDQPAGTKDKKVELANMGLIPEEEAVEADSTAAEEDNGAVTASTTAFLDGLNNRLWRNSVQSVGGSSVGTAAEGELETPTSQMSQTPVGSIAGMTVLNERMAVLARAEELEVAIPTPWHIPLSPLSCGFTLCSHMPAMICPHCAPCRDWHSIHVIALQENRKPRHDSANPMKPRGAAFLDEDHKSLRDKFQTPPRPSLAPAVAAAAATENAAESTPSGRPHAISISFTPPPTASGSTEGGGEAQGGGGNLSEPMPSNSPTGRRRAPPPLSVLIESTEPTEDEILMLSEEEAQVLSAGKRMENVRASQWTIDQTSSPDQMPRQLTPVEQAVVDGTSVVEEFSDDANRIPGVSNMPPAEASMPSEQPGSSVEEGGGAQEDVLVL